MTSATTADTTEAALLQLGRALVESGYRFTTVTPATHARVNARPGNERARSPTDVFGWSRPFARGLLPANWMRQMEAAGVLVPQGDDWRSDVRASALGDTLFLHSAYPTTASDAVFFGPDTYRYVGAIDRHLGQLAAAGGQPVRRAIDIGCGSGAAAVRIALAEPGAEVIGVDINDRALSYSRVNARLAETSNTAWVKSDLLAAVDGQFDLIVANPPYLLDAEERVYRHGGGGLGEGLSLDIVKLAGRRLAPGGTLLLYTGTAVCGGVDRFRAAAAERLNGAGLAWRYEELDPDVFGEELAAPAYSKADRIAAVLLTATRAS